MAFVAGTLYLPITSGGTIIYKCLYVDGATGDAYMFDMSPACNFQVFFVPAGAESKFDVLVIDFAGRPASVSAPGTNIQYGPAFGGTPGYNPAGVALVHYGRIQLGGHTASISNPWSFLLVQPYAAATQASIAIVGTGINAAAPKMYAEINP